MVRIKAEEKNDPGFRSAKKSKGLIFERQSSPIKPPEFNMFALIHEPC
jgi:hypothetical protein